MWYAYSFQSINYGVMDCPELIASILHHLHVMFLERLGQNGFVASSDASENSLAEEESTIASPKAAISTTTDNRK